MEVWKDAPTLCKEFVRFLEDNKKYLSEPFTDETDCINFVENITKDGQKFLKDINLTRLPYSERNLKIWVEFNQCSPFGIAFLDGQHQIFSTIAASLLIDFPSLSDNVKKSISSNCSIF